jgi:hypothetical protein
LARSGSRPRQRPTSRSGSSGWTRPSRTTPRGTTAIEAKIAAQEKLGFSDDALRDSLGALVVKTKDVAKAQQLQTIAMDLARARGIDLGTATDVLIKIQNGQYRALKGLGIAIVPVTKAQDALKASNKNATEAQKRAAKALDDTATKALALSAIQKSTKGQAQAYGDTQVGIFESIKITVGDVVEDLGGLFLPMLKGVSLFARDTVVPALSLVVTTVGTWIKANQPLIAQVGSFVTGYLKYAIAGVVAFGQAIFAALPTIMAIGKTIFDFVVPKVRAFIDTMVKPGGVVESVGKVVGPIVADMLPALGKIASVIFDKLLPAVGDFVGALWGDGKGPLAIAVTAIAGFFTNVLLPSIQFVLDVIGNIIGAIKDVLTWLGILDKQQVKVIDPVALKQSQTAIANDNYNGPHARGGPFKAGIPFGAAPRESLMMATGDGYVIPDGGAAARNAGGGGGRAIHTHIYLNGREIARAVQKEDYYDLGRQAPTSSRA